MSFLEISRKGTSKNLSVSYGLLATPAAPSVFYKGSGINTAHITEWNLNENNAYVEVVYITGKVYQFYAVGATMEEGAVITTAPYSAPVSKISGVTVTDNQHLFELFDNLMAEINT